ncbi:MAG TPA: glycosyltransferase family A protein [Gaiellaceae bacterium]|nr:glycosyltransferase family A protein [Gaiellaceae bacterium]
MASEIRDPLVLSVVVPATNRPATLGECVAAIEAARAPEDELIVVDEPPGSGPAAARNRGSTEARGDVLVFVDADVVVHADALDRIRAAFAADEHLAALFGSYDDDPRAPGVVSRFRNLLHHYVHQSSPGRATTFWAGLGAVRRSAFDAVGGFDEARYPRPAIEDIELGVRLSSGGSRIALDPDVQGTHLKRWTLGSMIRSDLGARGAPWVSLLVRERHGGAQLNLGVRHQLSALVAVTALACALARKPGGSAAALLVFLALNQRFYALLNARLGPTGAVAGIGLHLVHHLTAVAAVPVGIAEAVREEAARRRRLLRPTRRG